MKVEWRDVSETRGFVIIGGTEFELEIVIGILTELSHSSLLGPYVLIGDFELEGILVQADAIIIRNQSNCYKAWGFMQFVRELSKAAYGDTRVIEETGGFYS